MCHLGHSLETLTRTAVYGPALQVLCHHPDRPPETMLARPNFGAAALPRRMANTPDEVRRAVHPSLRAVDTKSLPLASRQVP